MRLRFFFVLLALASCENSEGSRREPFIRGLPQNELRGVVVDRQGEAIVSATVSYEGQSTITRSDGSFALANPKASGLITVDARAAAADSADRFDQLSFAYSGPRVMPQAIVMAEINAGSETALPIGSLATPATIDASGTAGARLELATGTTLQRPGQSSGQVSVSLADVPASQLPLPLPALQGNVWLSTRAIHVAPSDLQLTAGARLSIRNDIALVASGQADLYRLHPSLGTWQLIGSGAVQAADLRQLSADLPGGGLYVFALRSGSSTRLTGRVLDAAQRALEGVQVSVEGGLVERSGGDGRFAFAAVPLLDASGAARSLEVVVTSGVGYGRALFRTTVSAAAGSTDLGDLGLSTERRERVRYLASLRGTAAGLRRIEFGTPGHGTLAFTDASGQGQTFASPLGWHRGWVSWVEDTRFFRGEVVRELRGVDRSLDIEVLARETETRPGEFRGGLRAIVVDGSGGGPLRRVWVQGTEDAGTRDRAETNDFGEVIIGGERFGVSTAAASTAAPGASVRSAFSVGKLDNNRVEFPLQVARLPRAAFDEFAVVSGTMLNSSTGATARRAIVRRPLHENDYWQLVLSGESLNRGLPRFTDPDVTGATSYRLGVPTRDAILTMLEGQSGPPFTPDRLGFVELSATTGSTTGIDVALDRPLTANVTLASGLLGLDPSFATSDLRRRLAARLASRVIELVPSSGAVTASGSSAVMTAPARVGALQSAQWLVTLSAARSQSGVTSSQEQFVRVPGTNDATTALGFLAVPTIQSPLPGATTARADEFEARWVVPPNTTFFEVVLESQAGTDRRVWTVLLRGDQDRFKFQKLVAESPEILAAARSWTLEVRAHRVDWGHLFGRSDAYQRLVGNAFSLRPGERGIGSRSSSKVSFSTP